MEFKRLADVEILETATDEANVLIEEGGEVKRVPKTEVGGTGFPTAIIKDSYYDSHLAGMQTYASAGPRRTYECTNITFEEAYETIANGGILNVIGMFSKYYPTIVHGIVWFAGTGEYGVPCIVVFFIAGPEDVVELFWTADGISTDEPGGGGK